MVCVLVGASPAVSAQAEPAASLQVVGGGECLAADAIESQVHERSRRIRFVPAAADVPQLSVRVARGAQIGVQLAVAWPGARRSERRLTAASCEEASAAVAFLIALTLDPAAVSADTAQAPPAVASAEETFVAPPAAAAEAPAEAAAAAAAAPAPAESDSEANAPAEAASSDPDLEPFAFAYFGVSVRAELATGVAPSVLIGPGIAALLELRGVGVWAPALQLSAAYLWTSDVSAEGGIADFQLGLVRVGLCPVGLKLGPATGRACVTSAAGSLNAQGSGSYAPRDSKRGWLDLGANLHLLAALGSLYLEGAAGFAAPLRRDQYAFRPKVFHQVAAVCWQFQVGVGLRFP